MLARARKLTYITPYLTLPIALILGISLKEPLSYTWRYLTNSSQTTLPAAPEKPTSRVKLLDPTDLNKLFETADSHFKANDIDEAIKQYKQIINQDHTVVLTLMRLGAAASKKEQLEQAAYYYRTAVNLQPRFINAYIRLGLVQLKLTRYEDALRTYHAALMLDPNCFEAFFQLSKIYAALGRFDQAISFGTKATQLQPDDVHTYLNLGHIYNKQGDTNKAIKQYETAIKVEPGLANAHYNLGYTLRVQREPKKALPHLFKALELQPDYPDAHIALAQAYWTFGDFKTAWKHYDWRWKQLGVDPKNLGTPLWDGSALEGKTILIYAEQGLGDTIQFIRYAKLLKELGATVVCKLQKPLETIMQSCPYIDQVITTVKDAMHIDVQAPLLNLPGILETTVDTIPHSIPYLHADKALVDLWAKQLASDKNVKIGLAWHVLPAHEESKSPLSRRSIPLALLESLGKIPGVSFYSLQKFDGIQEVLELPNHFKVRTFGADFDESHGRFMDSAALIENLDLVLSVDTSIIHLASALGKEVWTLLPYSPDCRWDLNEQSTPWYNNMRLFRQQEVDNWAAVVDQVKTALQHFVQEKKGT